MFYLSIIKRAVIAAGISLLIAAGSNAQTTQFTYQGRLTDANVVSPTNGTYEMRFRAFDAPTGGNLLPTIVNLPAVQVVNGVFTVQLDLGSVGFNGQPIYLELAARPAGSVNPLTVLNPRQQVTSAPYAIQSANASTANDSANLGGVAANQYVQTSDSRLTDARNPLPGSQSYIQNSTNFQLLSNFNISGGGTANSFTAATISATSQYNIGASRVLGVGGTNNTLLGIAAGSVNAGTGNSFFGRAAGTLNSSGGGNSFFGSSAGAANTVANFNSFFGNGAGQANTNASGNSFFGYFAGHANSTGTSNSFFGFQAGQSNTTDSNNAFFGYQAGSATINGNNAFFGSMAGAANSNGTQNTYVGSGTGSTNVNDSDNTYVGYSSGGTGSQNTAVGSGAGGSGTNNTSVGYGSAVLGSNNTTVGHNAVISGVKNHATAIGADAVADTSNTIVLGTASDTVQALKDVQVSGNLTANSVGTSTLFVDQINDTAGIKLALMAGGSTQVCVNAQSFLSQCSSSLRYKTNVAAYSGGLGIVTRLRPITFDWKDGGMHDVGFGAEEVAKVDPLLVSYNKQGVVEGVKYDRITTALVNAVKEQQTQIDQQNSQMRLMQQQINSLKGLVLSQHKPARRRSQRRTQGATK